MRLLITAPFGYSIKNLLYSSFWENSQIKGAQEIVVITPVPVVWERYFHHLGLQNAKAEMMPEFVFRPPFDMVWELRRQRFLARYSKGTVQAKRRFLFSSRPLYALLKEVMFRLSYLLPARALGRLNYSLAPIWNDERDFDVWLSLGPSFEIEVPFARWAAEKRKAGSAMRTVAFVHSWDNLTSKGDLIYSYDRVAVWGPTMVEEVRQMHPRASWQVKAVGMPQYDGWDDYKTLKPKRPYVLYSTGHPNTVTNEPDIVRQVLKAVHAVDKNLDLIVRLHPNDTADRYKDLGEGVLVEEPGTRTEDTYDKWKPELGDIKHFAERMKSAMVVCNVASTMSIDALRSHTPVINIAFDGTEVPLAQSVARFYGYTHYSKFVTAADIPRVRSREDLEKALKEILANRAKAIEQQRAGLALHDPFEDGKAGKRLAEFTCAV